MIICHTEDLSQTYIDFGLEKDIAVSYEINKSISSYLLLSFKMKSLGVGFLILSVCNQFHVEGAKENVRAGYKATLLCSVSDN